VGVGVGVGGLASSCPLPSVSPWHRLGPHPWRCTGYRAASPHCSGCALRWEREARQEAHFTGACCQGMSGKRRHGITSYGTGQYCTVRSGRGPYTLFHAPKSPHFVVEIHSTERKTYGYLILFYCKPMVVACRGLTYAIRHSHRGQNLYCSHNQAGNSRSWPEQKCWKAYSTLVSSASSGS